MKTVIIHGQNHNGSTCHIAKQLADKIGGETSEFFLPQDFGDFCCGCTQCFTKSEIKCPHYESLSPITQAIDEADVIILASPVYVYHATGAMKAFLDHYGWRWMVHRPDERMFKKQGVCISTAAGAGTRSTNKDMGRQPVLLGSAKDIQVRDRRCRDKLGRCSRKEEAACGKGDGLYRRQNHKTERQSEAGHKNKGLFPYYENDSKKRME